MLRERDIETQMESNEMSVTRIKIATPALTAVEMMARDAVNCSHYLFNAERVAPVNVHSHGLLIEDMIESLTKALEAAKQFQLEVQGR